MVEDGRPFCPKCRAPQVRVQPAGPAPDIAGEKDGRESSFGKVVSERPDYTRGAIGDNPALRATLTAGILGVLIGMIPLLGSVLIGVLAVYLYRRGGGSQPAASSGARMGAAAGAIAGALSALLFIVQVVVFHAQQEYQDQMLRVLRAFGASAAEAEAAVQRALSPAGLTLSALFGIVIFAGLAAIGGAVAAARRTGSRS